MPLVIEPLPENVRHRQQIQEQTERFLAAGGVVKQYGVTPSEPTLTRRELNEKSGRARNGERR